MVAESTGGGTARYLLDTCTALQDRGHRVHLICAIEREREFSSKLERLRARGVEISIVPMRRAVRPDRDLVALVALCRLLRRNRPDILHVHSSKAGALGRMAGWLLNIHPIVYTPHAYAFQNRATPLRSRLYLRFEKMLGWMADAVVAVSPSERDLTLRHGLQRPDRVHVILNGVAHFSAPRPREPLPDPAAAPGSCLRLGFVGRLEQQKQPLLLVELAAELARRGLSSSLLVAGGGRLIDLCREQATRRGRPSSLQFLGHVEDLDAFYRQLDVFVTTSQYEGCSYAILDAMAAGLPVVGFQVPGLTDLVTPYENGLLATPFSVPHLAEHIEWLALHPDRRGPMGEMGRQRVRLAHCLERQVDQLVNRYQELRRDHRAEPRP